jgi:hypothetical protein
MLITFLKSQIKSDSDSLLYEIQNSLMRNSISELFILIGNENDEMKSGMLCQLYTHEEL